MIKTLALAVTAVLAASATPAFAASYEYAIGEAAPQGNSVTGFITTTCDSCVLNAHDITGWSFAGYGSSLSSTVAGSTVLITGNGLVASAQGITFNFASKATNDALFSELPNPSPFVGSAQSVEFTNSAAQHFSSNYIGMCDKSNCYSSGASGNERIGRRVGASATSAPEIDSRSWYTGLTLLAGMILVLRAPRRRI